MLFLAPTSAAAQFDEQVVQAEGGTEEPLLMDEKFDTVVDLLRIRAERSPHKAAAIFLDDEQGEFRLTYADLDRQARIIAAFLQNQGLAGKTALLACPSKLETVIAFFGCLYAGVISVPALPPRRGRLSPRIHTVATDAQIAVALTTAAIKRKIQRRSPDDAALSAIRWLATDQEVVASEFEWQEPAITGDSLAYLQYTSGSTRTPRGAMIAHRNVLHNLESMRQAGSLDSEIIALSWAPLYHDMGLVAGMLEPIFLGGTAILMSPTAFFANPYHWLRTISDYHATASGGPNSAFDYCLDRITAEQIETLDLSSWKTAYCSAEPVHAQTLERFAAVFADCGFRRQSFYPCYGLAEATLLVSGGYWSDSKAGGSAGSEGNSAPPGVSSGRAILDHEIVIVDPETLAALPFGQEGEIWVAGPSVAQGYWRNNDETVEIFKAYRADTGAGPYLRTGDLGVLFDGELFVTGRIKDMIIVHGQNYYPQDIEYTVAHSHPGLDAGAGASFAVSANGSEQVVIVQELARGQLRRIDKDQVVQAIRGAVAEEHGLPVHAICLIKPLRLPRTSSGKVQRYICRKQFLDGSLELVAEWRVEPPSRQRISGDGVKPTMAAGETETGTRQLATAIKAWLVAEIGERLEKDPRTIDLDQPPDRYGLESLEVLNLTLALETRLGRQLSESLIWEYPTVSALADYLARETGVAHQGEIADISRRFTGSKPAATSRSSQGDGRDGETFERPGLSFKVDRLAKLNERLRQAADRGDYFYEPVIDQGDGAWVVVDGMRMLMMASYSYLGLLRNSAVIQAAQEAAGEYGTGTHGVRLLAGTTPLHRELELTIARFKHAEDAVVFSSGYVTNTATISALMTKGDFVICDKLDHASIREGCTLSQAQVLIFGHNDMSDLERCLKLAGPAGKLVVVDAVFSMDGDVIDLPEVVRLCRRYEAFLMVDEAHSLGVLGDTGRGIEEHFGLDDDVVDIKMGTLSKTIPSVGGYVAGKRDLISALKYNAGPFIYSAALPLPQAAAAKAAIEHIRDNPQLVSILHRNVHYYLSELHKRGIDTMRSETAIVPIPCQTEQQAFEMTRFCRSKGLFVTPIVYPAAPLNSPRLRTTVTALHTEEDINFAAEVLARATGALSTP